MAVATFKEQAGVASDGDFRTRVEIAMLAAAIAVQGEAPATPNHANRAAYAKLVLNAPESYVTLFSLAICAFNSSLTSVSPDATIQSDVNAVWNALAGTL